MTTGINNIVQASSLNGFFIGIAATGPSLSDGHAYDLRELSVERMKSLIAFLASIMRSRCAMIDHDATRNRPHPNSPDDLGSTRSCAAGQDHCFRLVGIPEFERRRELHVGPAGRSVSSVTG